MGKVRRAEQATSEMRPGMSSPDRANCLVLSLRECKRGEREPQAAKSDETPCARMKRTWNPFPSHPGESKEPISHLLGLLLLLHGTSNGQSLARLDLAQQMNRQVLLLSLFALAKEYVPAIGESWQKSPAFPASLRRLQAAFSAWFEPRSKPEILLLDCCRNHTSIRHKFGDSYYDFLCNFSTFPASAGSLTSISLKQKRLECCEELNQGDARAGESHH